MRRILLTAQLSIGLSVYDDRCFNTQSIENYLYTYMYTVHDYENSFDVIWSLVIFIKSQLLLPFIFI